MKKSIIEKKMAFLKMYINIFDMINNLDSGLKLYFDGFDRLINSIKIIQLNL
jgi:hypothetical protein